MIDQKVGRLDVAVHDSQTVGVFECVGGFGAEGARRCGNEPGLSWSAWLPNLRGRLSSILRRAAEERPGLCGAADDRREAAAVDELHGVVMDAVIAADAEDGHNVRMVQLGCGLGFDLKSLPLLGIDGRREGKHLERHCPSETCSAT